MAYIKIKAGTGYAYFQESPSGLQAISDPATLRGLQSGSIPSSEQGQSGTGENRFASTTAPASSAGGSNYTPGAVSTTPTTATAEQTQYWNKQANSGQKVNLKLVQLPDGQYALTFPDGSIKEQGSKETLLGFYGSGGQAQYWNIDQSSAQQASQQQAPGTQGDQLYSTLKTYLDELQKRGIAVNPNAEISPEKVAEFFKQAETEINPYYANQLKVARDEFMRSVGYSTDDIQLQERRLEQKYGRDVRQIGENAADVGFAQSGRRMEDERLLAEGTQNTIDDRRRALSFDLASKAGQFAGTYGTANTPSAPQLGGAPRVLAGEGAFQSGGAASPFYSLSSSVYDGLKGTQEFQQNVDVRNRASDLESGYRTKQAIAQQRTLVL